MELIDRGGRLSGVRFLRWYGSRCLAGRRRVRLLNHLSIGTRHENGWVLYWPPGPRRRLRCRRVGIRVGLAPAEARFLRGRGRRTDRFTFLQLRRAIRDDLVTLLIKAYVEWNAPELRSPIEVA